MLLMSKREREEYYENEWDGFYTWWDGTRTRKYSNGARQAILRGTLPSDRAFDWLLRRTPLSFDETNRILDHLESHTNYEWHHVGPSGEKEAFHDVKQIRRALKCLRRNKHFLKEAKAATSWFDFGKANNIDLDYIKRAENDSWVKISYERFVFGIVWTARHIQEALG